MIDKGLARMLPNKDAVLSFIDEIGIDYDGYESATGLKSLIDELRELARFGMTLEN